MFEKTNLLLRAFKADDEKRRELLLEALGEEADLCPNGYVVTVRFHITRNELLEHKADNPAHVNLTPAEHVCEMIQDCLYDGGPLHEGNFVVMGVEDAEDDRRPL